MTELEVKITVKSGAKITKKRMQVFINDALQAAADLPEFSKMPMFEYTVEVKKK